MQVSLPEQLNSSTLRFLMRIWPITVEDIEIHFNNRQWATPTGMVGLACLIDGARRNGRKVTCVYNDCDTLTYWERMGFFREVGLPLPEPRGGVARPAEGRFAEIRKVGDIEDVDGLTQELVKATHTSAEGLQTFSHILSEAMNNVCQHSGAYGFSSAQYWKKTGRVEFCIADSGRGLFEALKESHSPQTDADAIGMALKVGVTSRSPNFGQSHMRNRGVGLSCIERLVTANNGRFEIWSGLGQFVNGQAGPQVSSNRWTGTLLTVNMLRDSLTANFRLVMQQLASELRLVELKR